MTGDRLDGLPPELRDAVARRLRGEAAAQRIERRPRPDRPAPLSFAQQRLWLLHELFPQGLGYNEPSVLRLIGRLDVEALRLAFQEVVGRHEVLRTTFDRDDGGDPVQVVGRPEPFALPVRAVAATTPGERATLAARMAVELVRRPFDLSRGPLMRAELLRLGADDHVLVLCWHHIVIDQWSIGVLHDELSRLYPALRRGAASPLPELPVQYADFALWQREQFTGERLRPHLDYWRRHLAGQRLLDLRTDRPRPAEQSFAGARLRHQVPRTVMAGVRELAQRHGASTFMTLLAAFHALLAGYSTTGDVTIATPVANRARPELEPLIGFFVNTLPLRTTPPAPDPTFAELLGHIRITTLDAQQHQDLPFDHLVQHLHPQRTLRHNPVAQVALSFLNTPVDDLTLPGIEVSEFPIDPGTVVFDLDLTLCEAGGALAVQLDYSTDLFDHATARRMLGHLVELLQTVPGDPARPLSELTPRADPPRAPHDVAPVRRAEPVARTASGSELERALAAIWATVLGTDDIGATDDFFAMGGNSLDAARVAAQVSRRFGVKVPMRAMFDAPTVARLAAEVLTPLLVTKRLAALPEEEAIRAVNAALGTAPPPQTPAEREDR